MIKLHIGRLIRRKLQAEEGTAVRSMIWKQQEHTYSLSSVSTLQNHGRRGGYRTIPEISLIMSAPAPTAARTTTELRVSTEIRLRMPAARNALQIQI